VEVMEQFLPTGHTELEAALAELRIAETDDAHG
jgi:hypothetical protein